VENILAGELHLYALWLFFKLTLTTLDPYHITVTKNQLTKNLGVLFPDLRDEIIQAFENEISPTAGKFQVSGVINS
jgi:hypothetical protein